MTKTMICNAFALYYALHGDSRSAAGWVAASLAVQGVIFVCRFLRALDARSEATA
jgi:hypothetical protein